MRTTASAAPERGDSVADIVIFGAGDLAKMADRFFSETGNHRVVAFCVDRGFLRAGECLGRPLVAFEDLQRLHPPSQAAMFVAVGYKRMNAVRAQHCAEAKRLGYELASYVSPRCNCAVPVGPNSMIFDGVVVEPFARIGEGVIAWSGAQICHDTVVEDYCFFGPGAVVCGNCTIGQRSFLGANSTVRDGVHVAPQTLVGAGVVVRAHTAPRSVLIAPGATVAAKTSNEVEP